VSCMANDRMVLVDLYTEARVRIPLAIQQVTPTMQQEVPNIMDILPPPQTLPVERSDTGCFEGGGLLSLSTSVGVIMPTRLKIMDSSNSMTVNYVCICPIHWNYQFNRWLDIKSYENITCVYSLFVCCQPNILIWVV
jgi:hypothetical protein